MFSIRKAGVVALAAITVAAMTIAMMSSADARSKRGRGHGHHHHHHRGVGVGLATGLAIGAIGAGVAYGATCWQDRVVGYTRSGRPIVRRVNVC